MALIGAICCGLTVFGGFRLFQGVQAEQAAIIPVVRFADEAATADARAGLERLFAERPEIFAGVSDVRITSINLRVRRRGGGRLTWSG